MDQYMAMAFDLQKAINTLQKLTIQTSYENLTCLAGSISILIEIRNKIEQMAEKEENQNGTGNE